MKDKSTALMEKLMYAEQLLHRYQAYGFKALGLFGNPLKGQGRILMILKMRPQISQKELSYLLDMRQQSLSELLLKLESKGFITRSLSGEDRRAVIITLTDAGKAVAPDTGENDSAFGNIFDCLNSQEQSEFERYLDRLTESLGKKLQIIDLHLDRHDKHHGHGSHDFNRSWGHGKHNFGGARMCGAYSIWQDTEAPFGSPPSADSERPADSGNPEKSDPKE